MKKIRENAAGINIGSKSIFVGLEGPEVRSFQTFTGDLKKAVSFLMDQGIETAAMEATGTGLSSMIF